MKISCLPESAVMFPGEFRWLNRFEERYAFDLNRMSGIRCALGWCSESSALYIDPGEHSSLPADGRFDITYNAPQPQQLGLARIGDMWQSPPGILTRKNVFDICELSQDGYPWMWHRIWEPRRQGRLDEVVRTVRANWTRPPLKHNHDDEDDLD